jgi:hypothetical protein
MGSLRHCVPRKKKPVRLAELKRVSLALAVFVSGGSAKNEGRPDRARKLTVKSARAGILVAKRKTWQFGTPLLSEEGWHAERDGGGACTLPVAANHPAGCAGTPP